MAELKWRTLGWRPYLFGLEDSISILRAEDSRWLAFPHARMLYIVLHAAADAAAVRRRTPQLPIYCIALHRMALFYRIF